MDRSDSARNRMNKAFLSGARRLGTLPLGKSDTDYIETSCTRHKQPHLKLSLYWLIMFVCRVVSQTHNFGDTVKFGVCSNYIGALHLCVRSAHCLFCCSFSAVIARVLFYLSSAIFWGGLAQYDYEHLSTCCCLQYVLTPIRPQVICLCM